MTRQLVSIQQIEKAKREEKIIHMTAAQVMKDFAQFGVHLHFSGDTTRAYEELFEQLLPVIRRMTESGSRKLQALLYQIDVNPGKLRIFKGNSDEAEHITQAILERELVKVLTRLYFSEKSQE